MHNWWFNIEGNILAKLGEYSVCYFIFLNYLPFLIIFSASLIIIHLLERKKFLSAYKVKSFDLKTFAMIIYATITITYIGVSLFNVVLLHYTNWSFPTEDIMARLNFISNAYVIAMGSIIKYSLLLVASYLLLKKMRQDLFSSIFAHIKIPIGRVILLSLICFMSIVFIGYIVSQLFESPERIKLVSLAKGLMSSSPLIAFLYVILMILIVSAGEELVFRGIIYSSLRDKIGTPIAVVVGSILFTAYHYSALSLFSIYFFMAGILLTILYEKTGSIYPSVVVHSGILLLSVYIGIFT
jgi:membrane protease YdiL (CAAX protease family)